MTVLITDKITPDNHVLLLQTASAVRSLGERIVVQNDILLCRYESYVYLPNDLTILGELDLAEIPLERINEGRGLPMGLHVGKDLDVDGCLLRDLPDDLYVGHDMWIENNPDIIVLPKTIKVCNNIIIWGESFYLGEYSDSEQAFLAEFKRCNPTFAAQITLL